MATSYALRRSGRFKVTNAMRPASINSNTTAGAEEPRSLRFRTPTPERRTLSRCTRGRRRAPSVARGQRLRFFQLHRLPVVAQITGAGLVDRHFDRPVGRLVALAELQRLRSRRRAVGELL